MCPEDHFGEKNVLKRIFSWLTVFGAWAKFFRNFESNFLQCCQNCTPWRLGNFFMKNRYFKKHRLWKSFSVFKENFPGLRRTLLVGLSELQRLCPEGLLERKFCLKGTVFQCLFVGFCGFFSVFTQTFIGRVVKTLYKSTWLFSWETSFLKKSTFYSVVAF